MAAAASLLLQPHIHAAGVDRLEGGTQGPGAAAHLEHRPGRDRNALQQIGIDPLVVAGVVTHGQLMGAALSPRKDSTCCSLGWGSMAPAP